MGIFKRFSGSTRRITFGLSVIQLMKAFLQFFTVIISSAYFGTSLGRDVWLLSLSIVSILGAVILGPIFEIFRAKYVRIKETNDEETAIHSAGSVLGYVLVISLFIILISELAPSVLSKAFAPSFSADQQQELRMMIRFIVPTLTFSLIISILSALLNIYNVFYIPELMSIFSSVLNVTIILIFAPAIGIYSLVLSGYLSNLILITVLLFALRRNKIPLIENLNLKFKLFFDYVRFALPFYFNYAVSQALLAAERIISTFIGVGSVSVLDYARKFVSIPISVIQSTVNVVLIASLTKTYINEGEKIFLVKLDEFINLIFLLSLPLITIFIVCPVDTVRIFLLRGAFDSKFVEPTANALLWFGFGIVSIIFYSPNSQALVAQGKTKVYATISGSLGFFVLAINLLFFKKYGIQILALSWSLGHFIAGLIMYFLVSFKEFKFLLIEFFRKAFIFIIVISLCLILFYFLSSYIIIGNNVPKSLFRIGIIATNAIIFEYILIYILRFNERHIITKYVGLIKTN